MHPICILFGFLLNYVASYEVTPVSNQTYIKPYNPVWCAEMQRLYMGDYADGKILCYIPSENTIYAASVPGITTPWYLLPTKSCTNKQQTTPTNNFVTTRNHTNVVIEWDGKSPNATLVRDTFTVETDPAYVLHNWHTAKASPQGHFIGGTLRQNLCGNSSEPIAAGYSYSKCLGVETIIKNEKIFGGFEWNANGDKFYHINSCDMSVWEYDYDGNTGKISNGRMVFHYEGNYGDPTSFPLQLTVDTVGHLYITIYLGGVVLKCDPRTGAIVEVIYIPGLVVAGITWGGANMDILFVSTFSKARQTYTGATIDKTYPGSGLLYAVTQLGAKGSPGRKLCI